MADAKANVSTSSDRPGWLNADYGSYFLLHAITKHIAYTTDAYAASRWLCNIGKHYRDRNVARFIICASANQNMWYACDSCLQELASEFKAVSYAFGKGDADVVAE